MHQPLDKISPLEKRKNENKREVDGNFMRFHCDLCGRSDCFSPSCEHGIGDYDSDYNYHPPSGCIRRGKKMIYRYRRVVRTSHHSGLITGTFIRLPGKEGRKALVTEYEGDKGKQKIFRGVTTAKVADVSLLMSARYASIIEVSPSLLKPTEKEVKFMAKLGYEFESTPEGDGIY
ncbi:hypothetical protein GYA37_03585 [candidate division WWE3 bacterium]|uniref:Uncharacterized protein n=1 Tax=candidate division WWE3 bacterium TaxID=2053526 RepID=A0A7X9E7K3_UNCKA|nr:hypothetical protein [candidate division WWE3 bacterium]